MKYVGTVILNKSEEEFWNSTPREINALFKIHVRINTVPKSSKRKDTVVDGYIDQVL
jgi:hypothetical protein